MCEIKFYFYLKNRILSGAEDQTQDVVNASHSTTDPSL